MEIAIRPAIFKKCLKDILGGGTKEVVNFYVDKDRSILELQTSIVVVASVEMPVDILADSDSFDMSIVVDKLVFLVTDNEDVNVKFSEAFISISQGDSYYNSYSRSPEQRIPPDKLGLDAVFEFPLSSFKRICILSRLGESIAKSLAVSPKNLNVVDGRAVIAYPNTVIIKNLDMENFSMSSEALTKLKSFLSTSSSAKYGINRDEGLIALCADRAPALVVTGVEPNVTSILNLVNLSEDMDTLCSVNLAAQSRQIDALVGITQRGKVEFTVTDAGLRFDLKTPTTMFSIGLNGCPMVSMKITMAQLNIINKMFGDGVVTVKKGGKLLCLESNSEKILLSGLMY